ncbi:Gfo/Idh/MocA family oxidoreductase [Pyxidicoccus fallax]|uniref:Gfo/Idh/MocA family oxidoreductase n=1 Tax=Pyxidicoccus fallax TaxID=394095 RepID=A0A848L6U6_9BACT|nr:Gfo/Idh/MocA family oxidoreductase [Pyxidicoccus fallax]NMO14459.1 Gfo/Idh/MocA family oxidoreductase [Pyxidicoccus fallax]NPC77887.1 Gfo/Idh/MocA family oxidoreductase [Pyxidicoccus fallax]
MVRIGVIGTKWGLMHVGAFRAAGAELTALCGRSPDNTREVAAREGIPLATTDVRELCAAVDAVVVASPDSLHAAHVETALESGRAVLCEKPLTRTAAEARTLLARARTATRPSAVNFPYRMLPPLRGLKAWLAERPVRHLVLTLRNGFVADDGTTSGPLLGASGDWGGVSHVLDAALWLAGASPVWVQASLSGRPVHTAALHVGLSSGAVLVLTHAASPEPGIHGGWTLLGRGWEAGFSGGYVPSRGGWCVSPVRGFEHGEWRDVAPGVEPRPGEREPWAQAHVEVARRFLGLLRGEARDGLATLEDGATVQDILAAAMTSEQEGRRVHLEPRPGA